MVFQQKKPLNYFQKIKPQLKRIIRQKIKNIYGGKNIEILTTFNIKNKT